MPASASNPSQTTAPAGAARRGLTPEDLYAMRVPTDVRLTPDGSVAIFVLQTVKPRHDGYVQALWAVPTDGSAPARQLTIGSGHDTSPRVSPDGRTLAFLSDRRTAVEPDPEGRPESKGSDGSKGSNRRSPESPGSGPEREDAVQVYLLPLDGPGEARRLTDLPRGVEAIEWSPDGRSLAVLSMSAGATREEDRRLRGIDEPDPSDLPRSDYRYIDRLSYLYNGRGFVYDRRTQLWVVDVATGAARKLTDSPSGVEAPAWSPDSRRIAYAGNERDNFDHDVRSFVYVVDVESGTRTRITDGGKVWFGAPAFLPDGQTVALLGHRFPAHAASRNDLWLFAADGSEAEAGDAAGRNLSGRHDLEIGSTMNSDVTVGETARIVPAPDGEWIEFLAPIGGSYELWRIATSDGRVERLTEGRQYISAFDVAHAASITAFIRCAPTELADIWLRSSEGAMRPATSLNAEALAQIALVEPAERWYEVEGRRIQGWLLEAPETAGFRRPGPLVVEIHGGPQTQYGWSPFLEFQLFAANGISVWYCNPRGSTGYGQDFAHANFRDWGDGPMRDVLAGLDLLVAEGIADPARLGVTGGSYGGYLTNWIVGHDHRFRAALTARSVSDMTSLVLTGDLSGLDISTTYDFGSTPWEDPEFYRQQSPITYIAACTTPILIQHAEQDLRCAIGQAEELFGVLRANGRPARLMRVPGESHELTRSGTPYRRAENLIQVRDWFAHFLVAGETDLPPLARDRAGK